MNHLPQPARSLTAGLVLLLGSAWPTAYAASPADFVDEASAKGIAEIEMGKLALEKGDSPDVKAFAEQMIKDHTQANQKLATLAQQKNLKVATEAELINKAKAMILELRSGEHFDQAYANNQVRAHEATVELFRTEMQNSSDADLKAFAGSTLPTLEHHLGMAKKLAEAHQNID